MNCLSKLRQRSHAGQRVRRRVRGERRRRAPEPRQPAAIERALDIPERRPPRRWPPCAPRSPRRRRPRNPASNSAERTAVAPLYVCTVAPGPAAAPQRRERGDRPQLRVGPRRERIPEHHVGAVRRLPREHRRQRPRAPPASGCAPSRGTRSPAAARAAAPAAPSKPEVVRVLGQRQRQRLEAVIEADDLEPPRLSARLRDPPRRDRVRPRAEPDVEQHQRPRILRRSRAAETRAAHSTGAPPRPPARRPGASPRRWRGRASPRTPSRVVTTRRSAAHVVRPDPAPAVLVAVDRLELRARIRRVRPALDGAARLAPSARGSGAGCGSTAAAARAARCT